MAKPLRYTSFAPGELEAELKRRCPGLDFSTRVQVENVTRRKGLLKAHCFDVTYPDHYTGTCKYERKGPAFHYFEFDYVGVRSLPRQYYSKSTGEMVGRVEEIGRELAAVAFEEAVRGERDHYFKRASESPHTGRLKRPELYVMKGPLAKELAGMYAVARLPKLVVHPGVTPLYAKIEEANAQWLIKCNPELVVVCCNRLDRCWEVPYFNPLYKVHDMRPNPPVILGSEEKEDEEESEEDDGGSAS